MARKKISKSEFLARMAAGRAKAAAKRRTRKNPGKKISKARRNPFGKRSNSSLHRGVRAKARGPSSSSMRRQSQHAIEALVSKERKGAIQRWYWNGHSFTDIKRSMHHFATRAEAMAIAKSIRSRLPEPVRSIRVIEI